MQSDPPLEGLSPHVVELIGGEAAESRIGEAFVLVLGEKHGPRRAENDECFLNMKVYESHEFCCWKIHGYSTLVKLHPETGVYAHVLRDYMLMMTICRCIDTGACLNPVTAGVIHSFLWRDPALNLHGFHWFSIV